MYTIKKVFFLLILMGGIFGCSDSSKTQGDENFKTGNYQQAVEEYSTKLAIDPDNVSALYGRARAYDEMGNYDAAIQDLETALKYDDRNIKVLLSLGDVFYKQKKFDNALYYYQLATNLDSTNAMAIFKEGRAYHKLGKVEEALSRYDAALREDKDLGDAYLFRGALKVSANKKKSACADLKKALELNVDGAKEAVQQYCK